MSKFQLLMNLSTSFLMLKTEDKRKNVYCQLMEMSWTDNP